MLVFFEDDKIWENFSKISTSHRWNLDTDVYSLYVINDEYVEFRKAVAEGKTVTDYNGVITAQGHFKDYMPSELRIKPNETTWKPKEGDVVVCWDDKWSDYAKNIIRINTYMKLKDVLEFDNCIPYIGQKFEDMNQ